MTAGLLQSGVPVTDDHTTPVPVADDRATPDRGFPSFSDWPVRGWALGRLAVAYLVLTAIGLLLGYLLVHTPLGDPIEQWDAEISQAIAADRTVEFTDVSDYSSSVGGTIPIVVGVAFAAVVFAFSFKRWRESASVLFALGLEASVFITVSTLVGRSRPPVEQLDVSPPTASFPSGHTGAATAMYAMLALVVWWRSDNRLARTLFIVVAVVAAGGVAVSRVYRGMHFVTDVAVGMALGGAATFAAAWIVTQAVERRSVQS